MKKITLFKSFLTLAVCAAIVLLSACGDDEKPANQFSVDGHKVKIAHAYMLSITGTDGDGNDASNHVIFLASEGVEYDADADELVGDGDVAIVVLGSEGHSLKKGTYELGEDFGDVFLLRAGLGVEDGVITEAIYEATDDGSVKVTASSSNKITLKFNFGEYDYDSPSGGGSEEGTFKGYYSGKVEVTEVEGGAKLAKRVLDQFQLKK